MLLILGFIFSLGSLGSPSITYAGDPKTVDPSMPPAEVVQDNSVLNLTDAQIATIVLEEGRSGIELGKFAQSKSKNSKTTQYAKQMIAASTTMNKQATDLLKVLHLQSDDTKISNHLKIETKSQLGKLKDLSGPVLDKAYIDTEVRYHQSMLDTFDITLIPNAQNEELKSFLLDKIRPSILLNLQNAQKLQEELGPPPS